MPKTDAKPAAPAPKPSRRPAAGRQELRLPLNWRTLAVGLALVVGVVLLLYSLLSLIGGGFSVPDVWLLAEGALLIILSYFVLRDAARPETAAAAPPPPQDDSPNLMGDMVCADCGADFGAGGQCPKCSSRSRLQRDVYDRLKS